MHYALYCFAVGCKGCGPGKCRIVGPQRTIDLIGGYVQEAAGRRVVLPAFAGGFQQGEGAVYVGFDKGFRTGDGAKVGIPHQTLVACERFAHVTMHGNITQWARCTVETTSS